MNQAFVDSAQLGIKGVNYYWTRRERFNISEEELRAVGVNDEHAYVDARLGEPLQKANMLFAIQGYELIIKDGYRPTAMYELAQRKRYEIHGKEVTDALLNMETMPHASGLVVDISLLDLKTGSEIMLRDKADGLAACFTEYYRERSGVAAQEFQRRQDMLISIMQSCGFSLGVKNEYWHFEYPAYDPNVKA